MNWGLMGRNGCPAPARAGFASSSRHTDHQLQRGWLTGIRNYCTFFFGLLVILPSLANSFGLLCPGLSVSEFPVSTLTKS